ncbi:hypothetical protein OROGR_021638 [Orobanche gracilis]
METLDFGLGYLPHTTTGKILNRSTIRTFVVFPIRQERSKVLLQRSTINISWVI